MPNRKRPARFSRISLRTRLTTISIALIGVLIVASSLGTLALLKTYLQQNQDTLLNSTASTLQHEDPALLEERLASQQVQLPRLPSDYYIAYLDPDGTLLIGLVSAASKTSEVPNISGFNSDAVAKTKGIPFEVQSKKVPSPSSTTGAGSTSSADATIESWRMVAVPLTTTPGSLIVALPTAQNDALINQYRAVATIFGGLLLVISGAAIWLTITSALRPLREVERVAKMVAKGDITQRLIERPGKTELGRINHSLNTMLGSIENAMQSRNKTLEQMRRFVSDASHELRTPLVSVRGYAELYRMGAMQTPQQVAEAMSRIESEAVRMSQLVESLLTLARLDETAQLQKTSTDLVSLARESAKDVSVADHQRTIVVTDFSGRPLGPEVSAMANVNAAAIHQVMTNLLANAARFSPLGGQIEIAFADAPKDRLVIEVRDHGEGIPRELRGKVFERFYRVDNSRNRETGGSGIGLAIVASIVAAHSGEIMADETAGGGCTMRISLPKK